MVKYSVIIPVYNGEDYIEECLCSVTSQTIPENVEIELLVIDDGSTDHTMEICNRLLVGEHNSFIFSKENEGLLLTRRYGLKQSQGDWIVFLDADDYLEKDFFTYIELYRQKNDSIDLIIFSNNIVTDDKRIISVNSNIFADATIFSTEEDKYILFHEMAKSTRINSMWRKVAKREIYDIETDYTKYGKVKGEDVLQSIPLLANSKCIIYCNHVLYNYRMSVNGLGRNIKPKYVFDYSKVYDCLYNHIKLHYNNSKALLDFYKQYFTYYILLIRALSKNVSFAEYQKCINYVKSDKKFVESKCIRNVRFAIWLQYCLEFKLTYISYLLFVCFFKLKRTIVR